MNSKQKSYEFIVQSSREDIDFVNKIIEAYEGVGVVRTLDPAKGLLSIISTYDFKDFIKEIIEDLGRRWVKAEIIEEGLWTGRL